AIDAFARQQFATRGVALLGLGAATFMDACEQGAQVVHLAEQGGLIGGELRRAGIDLGIQDGHRVGSGLSVGWMALGPSSGSGGSAGRPSASRFSTLRQASALLGLVEQLAAD